MKQSKASDSKLTLFEVMLEFVRAAVLNRIPAVPQYLVIDWDKLMDISVEQGVLAWVWDGIVLLPKEQQPPRIFRINFGMSAQKVWDTYEKHLAVLKEILLRCEQCNIRLLLLKGIGLSVLYPKPQSRSCGDIDIYPFEDFDKFNLLFQDKLREVEGKHTIFYIDDVMVENHHEFLNPDTRQKVKISNYIKNRLTNVNKTSFGYYELEPMTNFIFITMHTIKHLNIDSFVPIRTLLDFAFFLNVNRNVIQPTSCQIELKSLSLESGFEVLLTMSEFILGLDFKEYKTHCISQSHIRYLEKWISSGYHRINPPDEIKKGPFAYIRALIENHRRRKYTLRTKKVSVEIKINIVRLLRFMLHVPEGGSFGEYLKNLLINPMRNNP